MINCCTKRNHQLLLTVDLYTFSLSDWLKAVQAFSTLVFFGLLGTVGIYGAYVFASMDSVIMFACAMASSSLVGKYITELRTA